jgi:hypothetical protein
LDTAQRTLARIARQSDFDRIAAVIDEYPPGTPGPFHLFGWVGRIKTVKAKQFALRHLANPEYRAMAIEALGDQKATGVRREVAKYLDDEDEAVRTQARAALERLPVE